MSDETGAPVANSGYFVHPQAICESSAIGAGTRIWAFAHVLPDAKIGRDCNICDGVFIENDVVVGNQVTVKCGVQLWDGLTLEDHVLIGPNATFTNDLFPRSKVYPKEFLRTVVRRNASVGANATILPGINIGENAMVGAGSVVTRSVPANAIVFGNPARIVGYVGAEDGAPGTAAGAVPDLAEFPAQETGHVERGKEILRFLLAGGLNTALTYAIYLLATLAVGYQIAYAMAYVAGTFISYWLNLQFVFRQTGSWGKIAGYPVVYLGQYAVGAILLELLVRYAAVPVQLAPLLVVLVTLPLTFLLSKLILSAGSKAQP